MWDGDHAVWGVASGRTQVRRALGGSGSLVGLAGAACSNCCSP